MEPGPELLAAIRRLLTDKRPAERWTTWIQPGQVDDRLQSVTLDITGDFIITNVRHSVFGEP